MKLTMTTGLVLALCAAAAFGCGSKPRRPAHGSEKAAPEPAPPTPDTTPIEALRTPAGLVLKIDAPTPVPSDATPTIPAAER